MQTLTEKILKLSPPGGLFDIAVVRNLFPEMSEGARKGLVHRAVRADEVFRLKTGLFLLKPEYRKSDPHPYVVAAMLHSPSHVSLESALSFHGLIPEAVFQVASVTAVRSRSYHTPVGLFTFQRVPTRNPRAGVEAVKVGGNAWAFIATALRAVADIVYLRQNISWKKDGLHYLTESLRIEEEDLGQLDFSLFAEIRDSFRSARTREYLEGMERELH